MSVRFTSETVRALARALADLRCAEQTLLSALRLEVPGPVQHYNRLDMLTRRVIDTRVGLQRLIDDTAETVPKG